MKLFKHIMVAFLALFVFSLADAQNIYQFTLSEAIDYAMENNYDVIYSEKNIEAAKQQMREATSFGLPQLSGAIDYNDNIERPTSLIPGEFFGQPGEDIEIQFILKDTRACI